MKLISFIKNVNHEMTLVSWPTAHKNRKDTFTVVALTLFFILFFAGGDWLIHAFVKLFV